MDTDKPHLIDASKYTTTLESTDTMADAERTADSAPPPCRLLDIAGELRNRIYRLVLLTEDPEDKIVVKTNGYPRPAMLQTCKQVRSEALAIFYYENDFAIELRNLDMTGVIKFKASISKMCPAPGESPLKIQKVHRTDQCSNDTRNNWTNLVRSMKCSHEHQHKFMYDFPSPEEVYADGLGATGAKRLLAISVVVRTAKTMVDQPWELVEQVLINVRPTLGALNAKWMDD